MASKEYNKYVGMFTTGTRLVPQNFFLQPEFDNLLYFGIWTLMPFCYLNFKLLGNSFKLDGQQQLLL